MAKPTKRLTRRFLDIIGLSGVPDDIATWIGWGLAVIAGLASFFAGLGIAGSVFVLAMASLSVWSILLVARKPKHSMGDSRTPESEADEGAAREALGRLREDRAEGDRSIAAPLAKAPPSRGVVISFNRWSERVSGSWSGNELTKGIVLSFKRATSKDVGVLYKHKSDELREAEAILTDLAGVSGSLRRDQALHRVRALSTAISGANSLLSEGIASLANIEGKTIFGEQAEAHAAIYRRWEREVPRVIGPDDCRAEFGPPVNSQQALGHSQILEPVYKERIDALRRAIKCMRDLRAQFQAVAQGNDQDTSS